MNPRQILAVAICCVLLALCAVAAPNTFTKSSNSHYWLKNGVPFITSGYNRYDVWNPNDPANDGLTTTQYVQRIAQNGGNVIRVWAEQGDTFNTNDAYYLEYPAGTFNEAQALRLDELFNAADTDGVYVEICPWDTYNIKNNFAGFAYNTANGGPITSASQMISSAAARTLIKNKIQYMYNRWGSHPSFFLWTFNEINNLDTSGSDQLAFAQDVGGFIQSIDPYHPFSISYTGSGAGYPPLEQLSQITAVDIHFYGAISGTGAVSQENNTAFVRDSGYMNYGKPLVLSEWGVSRKANSDDLVNATMWGGIGEGISGTGMIWTDSYTYGSFTANQLAIMQKLGSFIATVNWAGFMDNHHASTTEVTTSSSSLTPYACLDKTQAIALIVATRVGTSTATTLTINGLTPGTYTVDYWNTYTGGKKSTASASTDSSGKLTLSTPAIATMQAVYVH